MDRTRAREEARSRIADYLEQRGIPTNKKFRCLNPDHNDNDPSMSLYKDKNIVKCFACKKAYDVFDLVAIDEGLTDQKEIFNRTYEILKIQIDNTPTGQSTADNVKKENRMEPEQKTAKPEKDYMDYFRKCSARLSETDYPERRGFHDRELLSRFMVGYDTQFKTKDADGNFVTWQALIIPTGRGSYVARNTDPKAPKLERYKDRGQKLIFNAKGIAKADQPIVIVEGELDALSIMEVGGCAIALGGLDNVEKLLALLKTVHTEQPFVIALDNEDKPNVQKAVEELKNGLSGLGIAYHIENPFGDCKDANEALQTQREAFTEAISGLRNLKTQAEELALEEDEQTYQNFLATHNASRRLQGFIDSISNPENDRPYPTGYKALDAILDGGLYAGLYVMSAGTSTGKTALTMQMADQMAQAGQDVIIFALEMGREELMARSISRETILTAKNTNLARTARDISSGSRYKYYSPEQQEQIWQAIGRYEKYAEHLFIVEGMFNITALDIRETVELYLRHNQGKRKPVVIVDYLQVISKMNDRDTDIQAIDNTVKALKLMSRDLRLPVFVLSSSSRNSNNKGNAGIDSFKGSGTIEYTADSALRLIFQAEINSITPINEEDEKKNDIRKMAVKVLKQRGGPVSQIVKFQYRPAYNLYLEEKS